MKKIRFSVKTLLFCSLFSFTSVSAQKYEQTIKNYINSEQKFQRANPELKEFKIINVDPSKSLKGDVVGIQQTVNGIPIFGCSANVLIRDGKVLSFADTFIKTYPSAVRGKQRADKDAMVADVVKKLNGQLTVRDIDGKQEPLKTSVVYFAKGGELILGYRFNVEEKGTGNVWNTIISTEDGSVLYQENTTLSCNFHEDAFGHYASGLSLPSQNARPSVFPQNIPATDTQKHACFVLAPDNASITYLHFL
ncbi:hypothetical protein [Chryseobacterium gossypii]|uniref:hypothetical protein n=1 Tax=Chryseobacterium gossypii TaxID=3231602 RepID=UPI00352586FB